MDDGDLELLGVDLEGRRYDLSNRGDGPFSEIPRGWIAAHYVFEVTLGDGVGDRTELEKRHAGDFGDLRSGER
ncbi:hypothetical protein D3C73_1392930 [compost metagenome]